MLRGRAGPLAYPQPGIGSPLDKSFPETYALSGPRLDIPDAPEPPSSLRDVISERELELLSSLSHSSIMQPSGRTNTAKEIRN
jgi:hypothetical protein